MKGGCVFVLWPWLQLLIVLVSFVVVGAINHNGELLDGATNVVKLQSNNHKSSSMIRELQIGSRAYDIGEPSIEFNGFQMELDYSIRDSITNDLIKVNLLGDGCRDDITSNNFLYTDVIPDLTPTGDGSESRTITVSLSVDPTTIADSSIINVRSNPSTLSFCVRFALRDADNTVVIKNSIDTKITVGIVLTGNVGITGFIEDVTEQYGVVGFHCDEDNQRLSSPPTLSQGSVLKVCVRPTEFSLSDGVVMRSIYSFSMTRNDIEQRAIIPNARVVDETKTSVNCVVGSELCYLETTMDNDFFYAPGIVGGFGEAYLQYKGGTNRNLIKVKFQYESSSSSLRRELRVPGGFAGNHDFGLTINVAPSTEQFMAEAFACNVRNQPINPPADSGFITKKYGESIRICVRPDGVARARDVYVRKISSFFFEIGDKVQFAIEPGSNSPTTGSLSLCVPGDPVCSLKTKLQRDLFERNGTVTASGEVFLQFGTGETQLVRIRKRQLQSSSGSDASNAGSTSVVYRFNVMQDPDAAGPKNVAQEIGEWWRETSLAYRFVYILALAFLLLTFCCCLCCCCWYLPQRRQARRKAELDAKYGPKNNGNTNNNNKVAPPSTSTADAAEDVEKPKSSRRGSKRFDNNDGDDDYEKPKSSRRGSKRFDNNDGDEIPKGSRRGSKRFDNNDDGEIPKGSRRGSKRFDNNDGNEIPKGSRRGSKRYDNTDDGNEIPKGSRRGSKRYDSSSKPNSIKALDADIDNAEIRPRSGRRRSLKNNGRGIDNMEYEGSNHHQPKRKTSRRGSARAGNDNNNKNNNNDDDDNDASSTRKPRSRRQSLSALANNNDPTRSPKPRRRNSVGAQQERNYDPPPASATALVTHDNDDDDDDEEVRPPSRKNSRGRKPSLGAGSSHSKKSISSASSTRRGKRRTSVGGGAGAGDDAVLLSSSSSHQQDRNSLHNSEGQLQLSNGSGHSRRSTRRRRSTGADSLINKSPKPLSGRRKASLSNNNNTATALTTTVPLNDAEDFDAPPALSPKRNSTRALAVPRLSPKSPKRNTVSLRNNNNNIRDIVPMDP